MRGLTRRTPRPCFTGGDSMMLTALDHDFRDDLCCLTCRRETWHVQDCFGNWRCFEHWEPSGKPVEPRSTLRKAKREQVKP